jgi:hypothetical protein
MLQEAMKHLEIRWERVKPDWDDQMARDFAAEHVAPMKPRVKSALAAIARVSEQVAKARRECE